jgi:hypothetical protein
MNDGQFLSVVAEQLRLIHARMVTANESERQALEKANQELLELAESCGVKS